MKDNTMNTKIALVSVPMFNAPGMLRWARHFYRMKNASKQDKKYFLGVLKAWVKSDKRAKYCLECEDSFIEWEDDVVTVTIVEETK
jgi:hypothetical protein|tara:strand:+ start:1571 stop:1828 length:258 start_codon:yes stop_codon:yes gene_type:complete